MCGIGRVLRSALFLQDDSQDVIIAEVVELQTNFLFLFLSLLVLLCICVQEFGLVEL